MIRRGSLVRFQPDPPLAFGNTAHSGVVALLAYKGMRRNAPPWIAWLPKASETSIKKCEALIRQAERGARCRRIAALCKTLSNEVMRRLSKASRGGLAQLGEHLLCKQGVVGSIPSSSTNTLNQHQSSFARGCFVVDRDSSINRLFFKNS